MQYAKISGFSDEIDSNLITQFEVLKKLGISYFEPRGVGGKNISELMEDEVLSVKKQMDFYGIRASSIGSPIGKIRLSEDFEAHFELFRRVVHTAKCLGARYIRIFSFYHDENGNWTDDERKEVFSRLQRMIDYATKEDVILLHENEKDIYGDTVERCLDLMEHLYCEHFRAVFDPANFVQCGEDTKEAYQALRQYVAYMHIKDAVSTTGQVVPAGMGDGNFSYILSDLFQNGYDGFLSLEPHLGSFEGLAALELDDKMEKLPKSGEGTFTLAFDALQTILETIKQ